MSSEEKPDYPKKAICGNCGQEIWIQWSWNKKKEYATNTKDKNEHDWHQCRNWKAGHKLDMREYAHTPPAPEPTPAPPRLQAQAQPPATTAAPISGLKVSKITVEYVASKLYEKTTQPQQFEPEKKGEFNSLKLGVELDVAIYDGLQVENATKDYVALLRNNVKRELGL